MYPCRSCGDPSKALWVQWGLSALGGWNKPCGADCLTLEEANLWLCHSSGQEEAGSGPWAARGWERVLEMQTRLVVRAALPAPAVAVPSAAASMILAEGDAGSCGKKKYREVFLLLPCSLPAPWKSRMHFVNSQRLQSCDGHFPFPCLQVKRELIVKYNMLLL